MTNKMAAKVFNDAFDKRVKETTQMTYTYVFWILEKPDPKDTRPFPTFSQCIWVFDNILDVGLNRDTIAELAMGQTFRLALTAEQIVQFHQLRREGGACPRIKWQHLTNE